MPFGRALLPLPSRIIAHRLLRCRIQGPDRGCWFTCSVHFIFWCSARRSSRGDLEFGCRWSFRKGSRGQMLRPKCSTALRASFFSLVRRSPAYLAEHRLRLTTLLALSRLSVVVRRGERRRRKPYLAASEAPAQASKLGTPDRDMGATGGSSTDTTCRACYVAVQPCRHGGRTCGVHPSHVSFFVGPSSLPQR